MNDLSISGLNANLKSFTQLAVEQGTTARFECTTVMAEAISPWNTRGPGDGAMRTSVSQLGLGLPCRTNYRIRLR